MDIMTEEDNILIREFLDGNESSFNKLIRKYQNQIYWHARKMTGNHEDSDEVTQEVMITIYNKLSSFHFESAFSTWLYSIVSTRSLNLLKKRKVRDFFSFDDLFGKSTNEDIIRDYENKEKLEKVEKALQKIPTKQREVFIFRNFDQLSYAEISSITGTSEGALKANYFHAIKKITEMIDEEL
jgi:RNA polymerase sigma-70 factor (ECF subfamily)